MKSSRSRLLAAFVFLAASTISTSALPASWEAAGGCTSFIGSGWMLGCDTPFGTAFYWNGTSWSRPALWAAPSKYRRLSVDLVGQAWLVDENDHVYKAIGSPQSGYVIIPFGPSSFTADDVASGNSDGETYALSYSPGYAYGDGLFRYDPSTQSWIDMTPSLFTFADSFVTLSVWSEESCSGHTVVLEDTLSDLAAISGVEVGSRYEHDCIPMFSGIPAPPDHGATWVTSDMVETSFSATPSAGALWWWNGTGWIRIVGAGNLRMAAASPANGIWAIDDYKQPFMWK